jgi:hypothetical protein
MYPHCTTYGSICYQYLLHIRMSPMQDPSVQSMQEEQALVDSNVSVSQIM